MIKIQIIAHCILASVILNINSQTIKRTKKTTSILAIKSLPLSNNSYSEGLKETLKIASQKSASMASSINGYYSNQKIRIPFPQDASIIKDYAIKIGMHSQVTRFEEKINRAAELAAKKAEPILLNAILKMSFSDAINIVKGNENAATDYLRKTSREALAKEFRPIIVESLSKVQIAKHWKPISDSYNKGAILFNREPITTDLEDYVTQKAIDGLFVLMEIEEAKIRKEPLKYGSDLLEKIFETTK